MSEMNRAPSTACQTFSLNCKDEIKIRPLRYNLVEGETEETVIELILQARDVDLEKDGFFVFNLQGQDKLVHLKPLFHISHLIDITIVAMLDNDKDVDKSRS